MVVLKKRFAKFIQEVSQRMERNRHVGVSQKEHTHTHACFFAASRFATAMRLGRRDRVG